MIILSERNVEEVKGALKEEKVVSVMKDLFVANIEKFKPFNSKSEEEPYYEVKTLYNGEFFEFKEGLKGVDKTIEYLNSLSTEGASFDKFTLKSKIKEDIAQGKHKIFVKRTKDENQRLIRIYKEQNQHDSEYCFNKFTEKINSDFDNESFYIKDMGRFILVSSDILNCNSLEELFPKEISLIGDVLDKRTCPYCEGTVINESIYEYLEFCGCIGKEKICPECVSVYYKDFFGVLNNCKKDLSNMEKIEVVEYILKYQE